MPKTKRGRPKKQKLINGHSDLSLEKLVFPDYSEIKHEIETKIGLMPKLPSTLPRGDWSEQALKVLEERYLLKNEEGKVVETAEQMCWRVSWEIASAEALWGDSREEAMDKAKTFYNLLVSKKFLPNSPTLMNAGTGNMLQYSGCYVLPVEDSLIGIFDAIKYQALVHQTGGGTGFSFSRLRPRGSCVKSSMGTASGPVSFMRIFDAATNEIKQGGKRRGANMGILRVDHPDILEFIHCKEEGGVTNFNISVAITDKFMKAFKNDEEYDLIDPHSGKSSGALPARKVFNEIAQGAWRTGDPGLIFIDRINAGLANPVPTLGPIESTNPCGEQPLYPFDSCNLGSIFLSYFVKEENCKKIIAWEELKRVVRTSIRFMDNVIQINPYPLEEIRKVSLGIRRIGLGVGGWADMLIELGIPYASQEALDLAADIMKVVQREAVLATQKLAKSRGPFPLWPLSIYKNQKPRRNSTVTTIAPTGSISIIAGTSSGIEPLYAIAFRHIVKDKHLNRTLSFINPRFKEIASERGFWNQEIENKIADKGIVGEVEELPLDLRKLFATAHEIHHNWHIKMQSVFQKYTENAVSKTINMLNEVTAEDIKAAYLLAWETDCAGITVFRDGCKDLQVLNLGLKSKEKDHEEEKMATYERPYRVSGATYKLNTPVGAAFVTINEDEEGDPLEVFINVGKAGSDITAIAEALGRTISTSLRFRAKLSSRERAIEIIEQLSGIGGRRSVGFGVNKIRSLPDAVAAALSQHLGFTHKDVNSTNGEYKHTNSEVGASTVDSSLKTASEPAYLVSSDNPVLAPAYKGSDFASSAYQSGKQLADICPSCGAMALVYEEGCVKCHACGHSEC